MLIRRLSNGQFAAAGALDAELAQLRTAIAETEHATVPLDEQLGAGRTALEESAALFRKHGFSSLGVIPAEQAALWRKQVIGALMVANGPALIAAEEERIRRMAEAGVEFPS
jgi:hypothetical protein